MGIGYGVGIIGTWMLADGVASLWTYTSKERKDGQSFWRDHALRIFRCILGVILIILGALI